MSEISNLSDKEYYNLYGTLSTERLERLLEKAEIFNNAVCLFDERYFSEVYSGLYGEDHLESINKQLYELRDKMGNSKFRTEIDYITAHVDDLQMEQFNSGEYARSELHRAIQIMANAGLVTLTSKEKK